MWNSETGPAPLAKRARLSDKRGMSLPLPILDAIPDLLTALGARGRAVLQAPPGAGKTTAKQTLGSIWCMYMLK